MVGIKMSKNDVTSFGSMAGHLKFILSWQKFPNF